jgi:hypothetical protein
VNLRAEIENAEIKASPANGFQSARKSNAIVTEVCL